MPGPNDKMWSFLTLKLTLQPSCSRLKDRAPHDASGVVRRGRAAWISIVVQGVKSSGVDAEG